jgi:hypothetical protein
MKDCAAPRGFFHRYRYQILVPLIVFGLALALIILLSMGKDSPFTYATF